jgi:hypothetical protein
MLEVIPPEDNDELDKQIKALEWQMQHDANEKDRCIHLAAYDRLVKENLRRMKKK